jgi:hypothetical protein
LLKASLLGLLKVSLRRLRLLLKPSGLGLLEAGELLLLLELLWLLLAGESSRLGLQTASRIASVLLLERCLAEALLLLAILLLRWLGAVLRLLRLAVLLLTRARAVSTAQV